MQSCTSRKATFRSLATASLKSASQDVFQVRKQLAKGRSNSAGVAHMPAE